MAFTDFTGAGDEPTAGIVTSILIFTTRWRESSQTKADEELLDADDATALRAAAFVCAAPRVGCAIAFDEAGGVGWGNLSRTLY